MRFAFNTNKIIGASCLILSGIPFVLLPTIQVFYGLMSNNSSWFDILTLEYLIAVVFFVGSIGMFTRFFFFRFLVLGLLFFQVFYVETRATIFKLDILLLSLSFEFRPRFLDGWVIGLNLFALVLFLILLSPFKKTDKN